MTEKHAHPTPARRHARILAMVVAALLLASLACIPGSATAPTTSSSWGTDQLGSSTISAGGSHTFSVPAGSYDLKAEDCSHNVLDTQMGVYISGSTSWSVP